MNDLSNLHSASSPQKDTEGDFVVPTERIIKSSLLSASQELSPVQQRKKDAQELAELIYKIYNEYCPVLTNKDDGND